jgi:hypothetical protein
LKTNENKPSTHQLIVQQPQPKQNQKQSLTQKHAKTPNLREVVVLSKLSLLLNEKSKDWSWGWELNPYRAALQATA